MSLAIARSSPERMSGPEFRSFQTKRPDHERWELIEGVPVMMTPPFMEHNRIATNLENVLNGGLREHDDTRLAVQRPGIECAWPASVLAELGKGGDYKPEPDVAVVDYEEVISGNRFTDVAYLLAEVVSSTDEETTPTSGERWVDVKVRLYQSHVPCEAIILAEQERVHVTLFLRNGPVWDRSELTDMDDVIDLPTIGVSCTVGDLYADTRWRPRPSRGHRP